MVVQGASSKEQSYLSALAVQPKDAIPDRLYEVSTVYSRDAPPDL
jgi:hypothetical protein